MRRHRWIALVAIVGVLVHAVAIVRHHAAMTAVPSADRSLLADLAVAICHGASGRTALAGKELPGPPRNDSLDCPLCMGVPAAFVCPSPASFIVPADAVGLASWHWSEQTIAQIFRLHAFARGPPQSSTG